MAEHLRPKRWTVDVFPQLKKTFSVNLQIILYTFAYKKRSNKKMEKSKIDLLVYFIDISIPLSQATATPILMGKN